MNLNKLEILRYLGYNNQTIDPSTATLLDQCILETNQISQKRFVYHTYIIERSAHILGLKDTIFTTDSRDIANLLTQSDQCTLMAASLGLEVDQKIAYYAKFDLTKSLILDACASTAVEVLCDEVEDKVRLEAHEHGYHITSRFSPGYGDLPITLQQDFANVLQTYPKIGLTVTENSIMLPRKSVTALIGWQREKCPATTHKCTLCAQINCLYRKGGNHNE